MVPLCDGLFYGKKTRKLQMTIEQRQVKAQSFFYINIFRPFKAESNILNCFQRMKNLGFMAVLVLQKASIVLTPLQIF